MYLSLFENYIPKTEQESVDKKLIIDYINRNTDCLLRTNLVGSATVVSTPFIGELKRGANPQMSTEFKLVYYPCFVHPTTGVEYNADNANPFALLAPRSVLKSTRSLSANPTDIHEEEMEFEFLFDSVAGYTYVQNSGITTLGVYTPPT
jgi:hypothetical protein